MSLGFYHPTLAMLLIFLTYFTNQYFLRFRVGFFAGFGSSYAMFSFHVSFKDLCYINEVFNYGYILCSASKVTKSSVVLLKLNYILCYVL